MQPPAPGLLLLDRFMLVRELGQGGMGSVWLADDRQLGERVALKILDAQLASSPDFIALLREESRKASQLVHPNIIRVHEFFATDEGCFISLQYIDGPTLGHRGLRAFPDIVECALSLCDALEHAHRSGIIHRDIKPANVLCDSAGHYYLTDFGIASTVPDNAQVIRIRGGGSLPSMSPQQLDGEPASVADDIYALGALLYELLSGSPLFHPQPTPQRVREECPSALTLDKTGREIPAALIQLVMSMLDKSPGRRPAGIAAVRSVLAEVRADYPVERTHEVSGDTDATVIQPRRRVGSDGATKQGNPAQPTRIQVDKQGLPPQMVLAALGVLVVIAIGVVFLLPSLVEQRGALVVKPQVVAVPEPNVQINDAVTIDPAILAAQRVRADEVLGELLAVEEQLRSIGIERWGGEDWSEARQLAEAGDAAYRERDYLAALSSHRQALDRMRLLESQAPEVFARALRDGDTALLAQNQNGAVHQFEIALSIQPGHPDAQHGLQRALRLDRVLAFMDKAAEAERSSDWQAAESLYRQALGLDADWLAATEGLGRVREAIAVAGFEAQMAVGFSAVQRQDYARARQAFGAALQIRPGDATALDALRQVDADLELKKIVALRLAARTAENGEHWPLAVRNYTEILAIDAQIEVVSRDLQRAQKRVQLADDLTHAIADVDRFYEDKVAQQATAILMTAQLIPAPGPVLTEQIARLDSSLKIAATPVSVRFVSDNLTNVVIYKVGRLGLFTARTIDLKPGLYQAVGNRDGYRDVRRSFRVLADGAMPSFVISCEDPI
jgi:tetratricopeptide (TPR) repeat protein